MIGLMPNLRFTGIGRGDYDETEVGMSRDLTMLHELAVTMSGSDGDDLSWSGTLVVGNMFGSLSMYGYNSPVDSTFFGAPQGQGYNSIPGGTYSEYDSDVYLRSLSVMFDGNLLGQGFGAEVGRVSHRVGRYLYQRPDYTTEYQSEAWDNGEHYFDGGILTFDFGDTSLNVFGGRNSDRLTTNGYEINGMMLFQMGDSEQMVDQSLGFEYDVPLGDSGGLKLAYIFLDSNTLSDGVNRNSVYGGELDFDLGGVTLFGSYSKSDLNENTDVVNDEDNEAYEVGLYHEGDGFAAGVRYREIDKYFFAPGDWGRVGVFWNPTDMEIGGAFVMFELNPTVDLVGYYEHAEVVDGSLLTAGDEIDSYTVMLNFDLNGGKKFGLSYEDTDYKLDGGDLYSRWYTARYSQPLGENSQFMLGYTFSDADLGEAAFKGGLLSTQIQIKF
jgi:hypothetical protein